MTTAWLCLLTAFDQPRDLLRYVLAPRKITNDSSSMTLDPVARSIALSNYLADWTASLILIQPKPKHRIRLIEKLIAVAVQLRDMENFDCLMGVLAGLNSQPVYRLDREMDVIKPKPIYKKFRSK